MGVVWRGGSRYDGFYGQVTWVRLANRSATNLGVLFAAAALRDVVDRLLAGDAPHTTPLPEIGWAEYADGRVVAWNGGASDIP